MANGFKFSKSKTVCMHFCHVRTLHPEPSLTMGGDPIKVIKEMRFLGLVFETKLSFLPHIRALKARCMKALDVLKVLAATEWGADSNVLLQLYRALVRSKLDYGSIVYGSARKSYVKLLDWRFYRQREGLGSSSRSSLLTATVITFKITVPFSQPKLVPYCSLSSASNTPIGKGF